MLRLALFCLGITLKILLLGAFLSILVFYIFEICATKVNPEYDPWDVWFLYCLSIGTLLVLTTFVSFLSVLLNYNQTVAKNNDLCMATFVIPTFILFAPILLGFYSILYLIYSIVPISITYMQYWHFKKFRKNIESGKFTYPQKDDEDN